MRERERSSKIAAVSCPSLSLCNLFVSAHRFCASKVTALGDRMLVQAESGNAAPPDLLTVVRVDFRRQQTAQYIKGREDMTKPLQQ
jgi:hypothetical protein